MLSRRLAIVCVGLNSGCIKASGLWRVSSERAAGVSAVGAPTSRGETIDSSTSTGAEYGARGHKFTTFRSKESQKDFLFCFIFVFVKSGLHNV